MIGVTRARSDPALWTSAGGLACYLSERRMPNNLYMVIERFKGGDAAPVYRRFREQGRLTPAGLTYVSSWVDAELTHCYQLMETATPALLHDWMARWSDLVDFEVHQVIDSAAAAARVAPRL